jgi:prepilin-type N-terminal cleavage/methylation domain-containing protein
MKDKMPLRREEGFTLVELMIAIIILALIVFAAFNIMDVNIKAGAIYTMQSELSQGLKNASDAMVDQLRAAHTFTTANVSDVVFTSYVTGTNDLYDVEFFLENGQLIYRAKKVSDGPLGSGDDKVLASGISGLKIIYYDSAGTQLNDAINNPTVPAGSLGSIIGLEIELTMIESYGETSLSDTSTTAVRVKR